MKWVTREKARVDRIACPWLISRFVDREPVFLFVPAADVMKVAEREQAIPYDVPGVELGHHGEHCSFDAFLEKYKLDDPALRALALIVRGSCPRSRPTPAVALDPHSRGRSPRFWRGPCRGVVSAEPPCQRTGHRSRAREGITCTSHHCGRNPMRSVREDPYHRADPLRRLCRSQHHVGGRCPGPGRDVENRRACLRQYGEERSRHRAG